MLIRDFLFESVLPEMALPATWDQSKLSSEQPNTFKSRLAYLKKQATRIGAGSSRVAFVVPMDDGTPSVVKIAKNSKGLAQNEAEISIMNDGYFRNMDIILPLFDFDDKSSQATWLQTAQAKKVSEKRLAELLHCPDGVGFFINRVQEAINGKTVRWNPNDNLSEEDFEERSHYVDELHEIEISTDLMLNDLRSPRNWGEYKGKPVIIDLGFTADVYNQHYSWKRGR